MVEPRVDQLHRQDLDAQPLADPLVAPHVAAEPIAGEQRLAAEQGVAGPLEVHRPPAGRRPRTRAPRPASKSRRLPLADAVTEPRAEEQVAEDQPGVGREDQVGQARTGSISSTVTPRSTSVRVHEVLLRRHVRHVDALAGDVEFPAVIDAAHPVRLVAAEKQRRAAVRAAMVHDADTAFTVAKRDQLLAEQHQAKRRTAAASSDDTSAGIQYSRINWPMTVPGPTRVTQRSRLPLSCRPPDACGCPRAALRRCYIGLGGAGRADKAVG